MTNTLDLRTGTDSLVIMVTKGVSYPLITFKFIDAVPPSDMSITIEKYNGDNDVVFTVGDGLTVDTQFIYWDLGTVTAPVGKYNTFISTATSTFGAAIRQKLILSVS
jgi:hypothetical protein